MTSPGEPDWQRRITERLAAITEGGRWRAPLSFDARGPAGQFEESGPTVVSFASNDYLGLASHPAVCAAATEAIERWGTGAGASRLVTGSRPIHHRLEEALSAWKGTEAAVCFPTGFAANLGVLATLGTAGTRIFSDELNHASIVDGCRLSRAEVTVYRHGDMDHLEALLSNARAPSLVVTDTVFSMDGDAAPLEALAGLCRRFGALLVLDEAHDVLGPSWRHEWSEGVVVVRVGTMSKTLGAMGGFAAGPASLMALLVNVARPYIFTTAPMPAAAAAALAALSIVRSSEGEALVDRLRAHVARIAPGHGSPIVPVILGSETEALSTSAQLLDLGLWVPAIRPPTVPVGTSRLRVTLSAAHRPADVGRLAAALGELRDGRPLAASSGRQ